MFLYIWRVIEKHGFRRKEKIMEINAKLLETQSKLTENSVSSIMLTLNSKLNLEDAKLVSKLVDWKRF